MRSVLADKINAMLWDLPESRRQEICRKIIDNAAETFRNDEQLFIKALSSLQWHELIRLTGKEDLIELLTDATIQKLFPVKRRSYYTNARRLLSKYSLPASGQNS